MNTRRHVISVFGEMDFRHRLGGWPQLAAAVLAGNIYISIPSSVPSTATGAAGYLLGNQNSAIELQYRGNNRFLPLSHEGLIQAF